MFCRKCGCKVIDGICRECGEKHILHDRSRELDRILNPNLDTVADSVHVPVPVAEDKADGTVRNSVPVINDNAKYSIVILADGNKWVSGPFAAGDSISPESLNLPEVLSTDNESIAELLGNKMPEHDVIKTVSFLHQGKTGFVHMISGSASLIAFFVLLILLISGNAMVKGADIPSCEPQDTEISATADDNISQSSDESDIADVYTEAPDSTPAPECADSANDAEPSTDTIQYSEESAESIDNVEAAPSSDCESIQPDDEKSTSSEPEADSPAAFEITPAPTSDVTDAEIDTSSDFEPLNLDTEQGVSL